MKLPAQPNKSLMDGLACLQALSLCTEPVGSRELARLLRLEPTRVNRLLGTLASMGLAEQDAQRKYRPGPGIHALAAQSLFGSGLVNRAVRYLPPLHKYGHVVALGVLWRDQTSYLYQVNPQSPADRGIVQGFPFPAASSGIGLVLLAQQPEESVRELYEPTEPPLLPLNFDPPDLDALFRRLAQVREEGHALVTTDLGRRTLAVPVGDTAYAGVGFAGKFRNDDVPGLKAALTDAAANIDRTEVP
ncbi:IclR family transcriptional regulator [Kribbella sp. NPDC059898]|uniref:IclR family transcriptional regulator n=1 Tax=Kribbella sp. NPDC059898 TaxID=3346995 RepID=UPI00364A64F1